MQLKTLPPPDYPRLLISLDFDDTLFDIMAPEKIPAAFHDLIKSVRNRAGVYWGINTGRSYDFLKEGYVEMAKAPFAPDFAITMERHIYIADEQGYLRPYTAWNARCDADHRELFRRHGTDFDELFEDLQERFSSLGWWRQEGDRHSIEVDDPSHLHGMAAYLDGFLRAHSDISIQRAGPYLRFCHREYNKGTALQCTSRLLGIPECRTIIIGDGHNDIDTLVRNPGAWCGCPANAVDELKSLVVNRKGIVSNLRAGAGVIDILRKLIPSIPDR